MTSAQAAEKTVESDHKQSSNKQDLIGMTGVTTDLSVTYLRPGGTVGDIIHIDAECDRLGRRMAFTRVTFKEYENNDRVSGRVFARGSHTKFFPEELPQSVAKPYNLQDKDGKQQ